MSQPNGGCLESRLTTHHLYIVCNCTFLRWQWRTRACSASTSRTTTSWATLWVSTDRGWWMTGSTSSPTPCASKETSADCSTWVVWRSRYSPTSTPPFLPSGSRSTTRSSQADPPIRVSSATTATEESRAPRETPCSATWNNRPRSAVDWVTRLSARAAL